MTEGSGPDTVVIRSRLPRGTEHWLLLAILAAGIVLRAWGITDHGLWIDEYGTWWTIAGDGLRDSWNRAFLEQEQSPLYYLVARVSVDLLGFGALSLRLPSLLFGIGLLALGYPLALRLFRDRRIALLTVLAFALNERLIFYSQDARPYALALLCAGGSFYFYAALLDRENLGARLGYVLATVAAYYAQYLFGVVLLVQMLHLATQRAWTWPGRRAWLATMGLIGLMMLPGLWQLRALFARRESLDWISSPSGPLAVFQPAAELLDAPLLGAVGAAALLAWAWRRTDRLAPREARMGIVVLWLVVPFLLFSVLPRLFGINLLHVRYLGVLAPVVPMVYGLLMALPRGGVLRPLLPIAVFLCLAVSLNLAPWIRGKGSFGWFLRQDWEGAVQDLVRAHRDGDLILYRTGLVELDDAVRGEAGPMTREFVEWPILVHLPSDRQFERVPLPYSDAPEMQARVATILREASSAPRVWVVGLEPDEPSGGRAMLRPLVREAQRRYGMRVVGRRLYGFVHLVLLRGAGSGEPLPPGDR